jgi:hypothetical protein
MAKRYIDTNFFKSPFVRGLQGSLKSLYSFIICDCSNAGVWVKDLEISSVYIGHKVTEKEFVDAFVKTNKLIDLQNGKYFLPDFIDFQYPKGLSKLNPAHVNIISELLKFNLIDENLKGLWRDSLVPTQGTMYKEKEKDTEEGKEKEKEEGQKILTGNHLFKNSPFYNFELFEKEFIETDYEVADLKFYHESVKNWSDGGGNMRKDWIATARKFILKDKQENKLVLKDGNKQTTSSGKSKAQEQFERINDQLRREQQDKFNNNNSGAM